MMLCFETLCFNNVLLGQHFARTMLCFDDASMEEALKGRRFALVLSCMLFSKKLKNQMNPSLN